MELLIANGTLVTMDPARTVVPRGDVLVRDGRVVHVGPSRAGARAKASGGRRVLDAAGKAVLPGLIHGHLHACQTLFRGRADGLELLDWLRERIWPFEAAHDAASMRASADLTFAELILSGCTGALDMGSVAHYEQVFESARAARFRLTGGKAMMDAGDGVPSGLLETTQRSLDESKALLKRWHGAENGRLRYAFAPRFALSCSKALLEEVGRLARELGVGVHTHASENATECQLVREATGADNVVYLHQCGLSGPHVTMAHCVWPTEAERQVLRETRTVVCHCPSSNLKLASGIAPVPELLAEGVTMALGADGAPCNNNLDMFVELRLAALLHKPRQGPLSMPPMQVLELATLGGAKALGMGAELGSLEVGKRADLCLVDLSRLRSAPYGDDVVARLVYACDSRDVTDVVIDGEIVLKDRTLTTLDEVSVVAEAKRQSERLLRRVAGQRTGRRRNGTRGPIV